MSRLHVAVDVKNLALYAGGIAAFLRPLLAAWLVHRPDVRFSLVGPSFDTTGLPSSGNWRHVPVTWPQALPRWLRHPVYDNVLFPRAIRPLAPELVFSPYHDVRLPRPGRGARAVMMLHDTCLEELTTVYPLRIRAYYLAMLRLNMRRAAHIITISEASRASILSHYGVPRDKVSVVYCTTETAFADMPCDPAHVERLRSKYRATRMLFYPGGSEYRKNLARLVDALERLVASGEDAVLFATGTCDARWLRALAGRDAMLKRRIVFLGRLSIGDMRAYFEAADAVVYPTLCEGFGLVCLEAMMLGAPVACSDLPVLREVAGSYACYFDPLDSAAIARGIMQAVASGRRPPRRDARFELRSITGAFNALMDRLLADAPQPP